MIVLTTLFFVTQYLISFGYQNKFLHSSGIFTDVGMIDFGQFEVGGLDLLRGGFWRQTHNVVKFRGAHLHESPSRKRETAEGIESPSYRCAHFESQVKRD